MLQVTGKRAKFDVLLTSYEILLGATDRPRLAGLQWSYVIVDEVQTMQKCRGAVVLGGPIAAVSYDGSFGGNASRFACA